MHNKNFLKATVQLLGTCFTIPEEEIMTQDTKGDDMYFISKGDCAVSIRDQNSRIDLADRRLVAGDHFGEISLIDQIKRTATVISRNYCTLARISYNEYRELSNTFPDFQMHLK